MQSNSEKRKLANVGYCNPPEHSRFKAGKSGNPRGRPKGTLNMATVLERTLQELIVISENGQRKTMTKMQAAVKQLVNQAASGDLVAFRQLMALIASAEQRSIDAQAVRPSVNEEDQKVMEQILERFEKSTKEE